MRFIVLLLGLLAAAGAVGAAVFLILIIGLGSGYELEYNSNLKMKEQVAYREWYPVGLKSGTFFLLGGVMAFFASIFALMRCGKSAAALFIVAAIGPPLLAIGTSLQLSPIILGPAVFLLLVGVLALLIKPKPLPEDELEAA